MTPPPACRCHRQWMAPSVMNVFPSRLPPVVARPLSLATLLDGPGDDLAIDRYQRPYVWGARHIEQLLGDLIDFFVERRSQGDYYLGSVLLHRKQGQRYIVDGQQRLTTLCLLYHCLRQVLPARCRGLKYHQSSSQEALRQARRLLAGAGERLERLRRVGDLFARLRITCIEVERQDLAFTFFDTQNGRGVPLETAHLLKAFHLDAIPREADEQGEERRRQCARLWESRSDQESLLALLWRGRRWRGRVEGYETRALLLAEFAHGTRADGVLRGYGGSCCALLKAHLSEEGLRVTGGLRGLPAESTASDWPIALRQPIEHGLGFFLYCERFAALRQRLRAVDPPGSGGFVDFHRAVIAPLSPYLRQLYELACLLFVERFGSLELLSFARWLDFNLGRLRLLKRSIRSETPLIYLSGSPRNLLDVIAHSYDAQEVLGHLRDVTDQLSAEDGKRLEEVRNEAWGATRKGGSVCARYLRSVLEYYRKTGSDYSLQEHRRWMEQ